MATALASSTTRNNSNKQPPRSSEREQLILDHYPLVRTIASRMIRRFPASVELEELVNVGTLGLIDAVDRFDTSRNVPFKAYAEIRIRGSIVDALREADWVPRSVRRKVNRIDSERERLFRDLGRQPTREELAESLEISVEAYDDLAADAQIRQLVSLDAPMDQESHTPLSEKVAADEEHLLEGWMRDELTQQVIQAVHHLPKKERTAVGLYYLHGLTLKEIGQVLGVTESRACQLRSQGIKRLKFRMRRSVH
ncbi:MAG: FliA/WhiG family RNA polymerase sigma factor [Myxococcota bacterium]|nr:FliA/WhiG family RNA polymerase sigma factor [Myxococcota bacterium]